LTETQNHSKVALQQGSISHAPKTRFFAFLFDAPFHEKRHPSGLRVSVFPFFRPNPMIKVLGHRGVRQRKTIDENSVPAFEKALEKADGVETDATLSSDKTPFLCHELLNINIPHIYSRSIPALKRHLNRASAKTAAGRRLDQMMAAEIDALTLKKGATLPRLSALFNQAARHPGKLLNIELKGHGTVGPVIDEIHKAVAEGKVNKDQIILTSFNHDVIAEARRLDPEIKNGFIFSRADLRDTRIYPWLPDKSGRYAALNENTLTGKAAQQAKPDYFVMEEGRLAARGIAQIRKHFPNAKIAIWTTKNPERNRRLEKNLKNPAIGPHIDTIITDFPEEMVKVLEKKGLRPG
jgi:glycerophosphoryl diester phosphodiesterase